MKNSCNCTCQIYQSNNEDERTNIILKESASLGKKEHHFLLLIIATGPNDDVMSILYCLISNITLQYSTRSHRGPIV